MGRESIRFEIDRPDHKHRYVGRLSAIHAPADQPELIPYNGPVDKTGISDIILKESGKCVLCGLCLPACPTFKESHREADSPRGRIAYARALAEEKLPASNTIVASLTGCLQCRACESVCPSKVKFKQIVSSALSLLKTYPRQRTVLHAAYRLAVRLAQLPGLFAIFFFLYTKTGLRRVLKTSRFLNLTGLEAMDDLLPLTARPVLTKKISVKPASTTNRIGLFTGCLGSTLDSLTLESAQAVFNALGIDIVPANIPVCCGGLESRNPNLKDISAFGTAYPDDILTIVSCISGCTAELSQKIIGERKIQDISEFLIDQDFGRTSFNIYPGIIGVHEPCSLRYPLVSQKSVYELLAKIPGTIIRPLPENDICCGGAGDFMFRQPEMANKLAANKLSAMDNMYPSRPNVIVTSNLGCALNLKSELQKRKIDIEVIHPVTLLARQLKYLSI